MHISRPVTDLGSVVHGIPIARRSGVNPEPRGPERAFGPTFCVVAILAVGSVFASQTWETLDSGRLTATERRAIISAVEASAFDTPDSWIAELRVERVNLGISQGLVVQGTTLLCGATGNCQIFILRRVAGRWVSLFPAGDAPIVETFRFDVHQTRGIRDLIVRTNTGDSPALEIRYRFDGQVYRRL